VLAGWLHTGVIVPQSSIAVVNAVEYMGGVLDFTGEVNRYGIAQATKRNLPGVLQCVEVCTSHATMHNINRETDSSELVSSCWW
jgi:predicted translin family RNA/ssDNA-binding protein